LTGFGFPFGTVAAAPAMEKNAGYDTHSFFFFWLQRLGANCGQ
jgi:hypothetical protein